MGRKKADVQVYLDDETLRTLPSHYENLGGKTKGGIKVQRLGPRVIMRLVHKPPKGQNLNDGQRVWGLLPHPKPAKE